jgi:eukaryotic-like serine/threonine-protein kinase
VLEYVDGEPIDRYCDRQRLDVDARVRLFLEVLDAVAHAHTNLIVHRDLKPSTVLVGADGHGKRLDFGIAKLLEDEGQAGLATMLTREGGAALTPEYAAPEQLTNAPVTTATDG